MTDQTIPPAEMTLDELRVALAPLIPGHAVFDGWNDAALAMAANELGVPADRAKLAFPGGAMEMIDAWFDAIDLAMAKAFPPERIATMKIRARIRDLLLYRIEVTHPHKEALRRAFAILSMPQNALAAAKLAWRAADRMWRLAGDRASDFNHYSKRGILSALYTSTLLVYLDDDTPDIAATKGFLDRRIDDVMRFEKFKAQWKGGSERMPSLSRFLGRLRYPAV
ncbi:COQ9 family protein [Allosphingosinicella vermicomposti]|uniref:COQ9 family protein n=1 Tax=Allosphingosinicella vermicomposti TaxID=614671 RepID=UPI000D0FFD41|nr:COQ9 family protein [Allosphingosinicella vermicomposti]